MPKAMNIPDATAVANKEWKTRENTVMTPDENQKQKEVINEARKEGRTVYLAPLMDIFHLKNSELESKISKKKKKNELYSKVTL